MINISILSQELDLGTLKFIKYCIKNKINIKYFDLLEFELKKDKLLTNIDRNKYLSIFNNFYYDLSK